MHLLGDDQKRGNKNRTKPERFFKRINTAILAVQLACFLVVLSQVTIAGSKTFTTNFWFPQDFKLITTLDQKTVNCSFNSLEKFGGFSRVNVTIDYKNQADFFVELSSFSRQAIIVNGVTIGVGGVNKLMFDLNIFHSRYHNLYFHKEIVSTVEILLLVYSIYLCTQADGRGDLLRRYLRSCTVDQETSLPYTVPYVAFYFSLSFTLFFHAITLLFLLKNTMKKEYPSETAMPDGIHGQPFEGPPAKTVRADGQILMSDASF